jgi:hypothetical protein
MKKRSNILVLRNIKLEHLSTVREPQQQVVTKSYTEIPKTFISPELWPKKSNLKCWHCDLVPTSYPKFIPMYPSTVNAIDTCDVHGHFCEWSCAASYIINNFTNKYELLETLSIFEAKFTGHRKRYVSSAPPKTIRMDYCGAGGITDAAYRKLLL